MDFEVMPLTPAGHRFVALAEEHARDFATRAERHCPNGTVGLAVQARIVWGRPVAM